MWDWAALGAGAVVAAPLLREALRHKMDGRARKAAPGGMLKLTGGETYFRWIGPADGPVAICVHGLTTPSMVWQAVAEGLAADGYRVLLYDLFGRGYSDRPRARHDRALFHAQLTELLDQLSITGPVTLLGYSMGGAIAASWAAAHRDRVERLILLAPAGMAHDIGRMTRLMRDTPLLGDWLMLLLYGIQHRRATPPEDGEGDVAGIGAYQRDEIRWRGFVPAVLSSLRGILAEDLAPDHRALRAQGLPVLAIWGREDRVIPIRAMGVLASWNPDAHHAQIDGAGHGLPHTHARAVVAAARRWRDGAG